MLILAGIGSTSIAGATPATDTTRETQVTSPLGSVTLSLRSPQQFIEAKCLFIPLEIQWQRRSDVTVIGELTVRRPGSSVANADSFVLARSEPATGNYTDYVYGIPGDDLHRHPGQDVDHRIHAEPKRIKDRCQRQCGHCR
jgi:hypothetical protein